MKKILRYSIWFFLSVFFIFSLIPTLLSTAYGQKTLFKFLGAFTNSTIEADSVEFAWTKNQIIRKLKIHHHKLDLTLDDLVLSNSLLRFFKNGFYFSKMTMTRPEGSLKIQTGQHKPSFFLPVQSLDIEQAKIQIQFPDSSYQIQLDKTTATFFPGIEIKTEGWLVDGKEKGSFTINALFNPSYDPETIEIQTQKVPLDFLKQLNTFKPSFLFLGKTISGTCFFQKKEKFCALDLKTETGSVEYNNQKQIPFLFQFHQGKNRYQFLGKKLILDFDHLKNSEGSFVFQWPHFHFKSFQFSQIEGQFDFSLKRPLFLKVNFQSDLDALKGSFQADLLFDPQSFDYQGMISSDQLETFIEKDPFRFHAKKASLHFNKGKEESSAFLTIESVQSPLFSGPLNISLESNESTPKLFPKIATLKIQSPFLQLQSEISTQFPLEIKEPSVFSFEINPKAFDPFSSPYQMDQPLRVTGMIEKGSSLEKFKGSFSSEDFQIVLSHILHRIHLKESTFKINLLKAQGEAELNGKIDEGTFLFKLKKNQEVELQAQIEKIPMTLIPRLPFSLDPNLDLSGIAHFQTDSQIKIFDCHLFTQLGKLKISLMQSTDFITLLKPCYFEWQFSENQTRNWVDTHSIHLVSTPKIVFEIPELKIPLDFRFDDWVSQGKFTIDDIKLYSQKEIAMIHQWKGFWKKKKEAPLFLESQARSSIGELSLNCFLENFDFRSPESFIGNIQIEGQKVPTLFLKLFALPSTHPWLSCLGPDFYISCLMSTKNKEKTVDFSIKSETIEGKLRGLIEENTLFLSEDAELTYEPNPAFKLLLNEKTGLTLLKNYAPFTIKIGRKGSQIPLNRLKLPHAFLSFIELNFDQVELKNSGPMQLTDLFLKQKSQETRRIWFAPFIGRYQNQIFYLNRTDFLILPNIQLALWGKLDFNRKEVDLLLGLTAQTLKSTLGITHLPKDFVLTIPVRGPFGNVQINQAQAMTKIAALIASKQQFRGDLGSVLDLMNQMLNDQKNIPKAKRPFPWEARNSSQDLHFTHPLPLQLKRESLSQEELISYSVSIDPLLSIIQEQVNDLWLKKEEDPNP